MKKMKLVALGMLALSVSACTNFEAATRNAPLQTPQIAAPEVEAAPRDYRLEDVRFAIPADLRVSEANSYYPIADIVWRGDPIGDRRAQLTEIFTTAIAAGAEGVTGSTPVVMDVSLNRFHSLTERTRYTIGGVHSIKFDITIRHAETGEVLEPTRYVNADFPALGGMAAIQAEQLGQTQKVRVLAHLGMVFNDYLTGIPGQEATAAASLEEANS